jgi:hypothetical protein
MTVSQTFYARGDSNTANNPSINTRPAGQVPVQEIQFVSFDPDGGGPLEGDIVLDGNAAGTLRDPDTRVLLNGIEYEFELEFQGYYDATAGNNGGLSNVNGYNFLDGAVGSPANQGDAVIVITVIRPAAQGGNLRLFFHPDGSITPAIMQVFPNGAHTLLPGLTTGTVLVCFVRGTMILTSEGERPIEELKVGDRVVNSVGRAVELLWIGHRRVTPEELRQFPELRPVRIPAGRFGPGMPHTTLEVSPQHRVLVEGWPVELTLGLDRALVPAKHLVGDQGAQADGKAAVDYYHLLFEKHEIVVSNGLPTESLQPTTENVQGLDAAARAELALLFPEGIPDDLARRDPAAPSVKAYEGRLIARSWLS